MLPYFLRAEDNERGASELHGAGGPLSVIDNRSRYRTCEAFIEAGQQAGLPLNEDFNGPEQDGVGLVPGHPAERDALLGRGRLPAPGPGRPNLDLITEAQVTRLLLDGHDRPSASRSIGPASSARSAPSAR